MIDMSNLKESSVSAVIWESGNSEFAVHKKFELNRTAYTAAFSKVEQTIIG